MYYLGIDLGGTNISGGIVNEKAELLIKSSTPTMNGRDYHEIIKDMATLGLKLIDDLGITLEDIEEVGLGLPGLVDKKKGTFLFGSNLSFNHINVVEEFTKYIDKPIRIENDANCAAMGEVMCGAARGNKNVIFVTLGTGVGAGFIINGKLFEGAFGGGSEAGHMVIVAEGEECACGRKGCWEAYASANALKREGRIAAAKYPNCEIYKMVDGNIKLIDAKIVFEAADRGDKVAKEIEDRYIKSVAIGLVNLVNVFQPETVVLGGGICGRGDKLLKPVKKILEDRVYGGELKTKITLASLGKEAGIVGAATLAISDME